MIKNNTISKGGIYSSLSPLFFAIVGLFILSSNIYAVTESENKAYLDALIQRSREKKLSRHRYWHLLLHYQKKMFGTSSLIDDPDFFMSDQGKKDPRAELEATLASFFEAEKKGEKHPVCRFVARYTFLKEALGIDTGALAVSECSDFKTFVKKVGPKSMSLIFPTAHMNSPASMFGHTLLVIDTESKSKLLAHAINYAAVAKDTFGPLYAIKGLFGGYEGYFSLLPYYAKLQEYSDVNDRDIWEYPLNFTKEEMMRMLRHLYELDMIHSDYYFIDENCSYALLFLMEVARPSLELTDQFWFKAIPIDTVRCIQKEGVMAKGHYRASKSTKIKHIGALLDKADRKRAIDIAKGDFNPDDLMMDASDRTKNIHILNLASEYLQYLYAKNRVSKKRYTPLFISILKMRSELKLSETDHYQIPNGIPPDESHRSNRIGIGAGISNDELFTELKLRPSLHSLMDNGKGFKKGAAIVFGDVHLRYFYEKNTVALESLDIIDIVSITPRDDFFPAISWKINTGFYRKFLSDDHKPLVYRLNPGGGMAGESRFFGVGYLFFETDVLISGSLNDGYALGAGGSAGIFKSFSDRSILHLQVRDIYYPLGEDGNHLGISFSQNIAVSTNHGLLLDITYEENGDERKTEGKICWNIYF